VINGVKSKIWEEISFAVPVIHSSCSEFHLISIFLFCLDTENNKRNSRLFSFFNAKTDVTHIIHKNFYSKSKNFNFCYSVKYKYFLIPISRFFNYFQDAYALPQLLHCHAIQHCAWIIRSCRASFHFAEIVQSPYY
jgi:hypothetical protein